MRHRVTAECKFTINMLFAAFIAHVAGCFIHELRFCPAEKNLCEHRALACLILSTLSAPGDPVL